MSTMSSPIVLTNTSEGEDDKYTSDILRRRFYDFKQSNLNLNEIIKSTGLPIRHQNPPEDITENTTKFIIRNHDNDLSCKWAKSIGKTGDLYSDNHIIEVKSFTSCGPSSFGPKKKFDVILFLDLRGWMDDRIILWKVNVSNESIEWKHLKMNATQTFEEQCKIGVRPHISYDNIHTQIPDKCVKIYEGTFEGIFIQQAMSSIV